MDPETCPCPTGFKYGAHGVWGASCAEVTAGGQSRVLGARPKRLVTALHPAPPPRPARGRPARTQRGSGQRPPGSVCTARCARPPAPAATSDSSGGVCRRRPAPAAFALAPAASRYKGSLRAPRCTAPPASSSDQCLSPLPSDSSHRSARHGPQLLLCHRWFLHLRRLLQMQRLQVHLLQEELLLLLPRGLCQVRPGLRLQRSLRQVQLLCVMRDGEPAPGCK
ncbi:hypothetical protein MDA_GLEAN10003273 [Myotis davidii]|uniref:Uncharacterized protein n=1 Tax=Myotis davidii TaxID=225400 RepID=L5LWA8_MYODS|nr:hypothetical protein MDA_GLEAN10003273 [Myotis davidii]